MERIDQAHQGIQQVNNQSYQSSTQTKNRNEMQQIYSEKVSKPIRNNSKAIKSEQQQKLKKRLNLNQGQQSEQMQMKQVKDFNVPIQLQQVQQFDQHFITNTTPKHINLNQIQQQHTQSLNGLLVVAPSDFKRVPISNQNIENNVYLSLDRNRILQLENFSSPDQTQQQRQISNPINQIQNFQVQNLTSKNMQNQGGVILRNQKVLQNKTQNLNSDHQKLILNAQYASLIEQPKPNHLKMEYQNEHQEKYVQVRKNTSGLIDLREINGNQKILASTHSLKGISVLADEINNQKLKQFKQMNKNREDASIKRNQFVNQNVNNELYKQQLQNANQIKSKSQVMYSQNKSHGTDQGQNSLTITHAQQAHDFITSPSNFNSEQQPIQYIQLNRIQDQNYNTQYFDQQNQGLNSSESVIGDDFVYYQQNNENQANLQANWVAQQQYNYDFSQQPILNDTQNSIDFYKNQPIFIHQQNFNQNQMIKPVIVGQSSIDNLNMIQSIKTQQVFKVPLNSDKLQINKNQIYKNLNQSGKVNNQIKSQGGVIKNMVKSQKVQKKYIMHQNNIVAVSEVNQQMIQQDHQINKKNQENGQYIESESPQIVKNQQKQNENTLKIMKKKFQQNTVISQANINQLNAQQYKQNNLNIPLQDNFQLTQNQLQHLQQQEWNQLNKQMISPQITRNNQVNNTQSNSIMNQQQENMQKKQGKTVGDKKQVILLKNNNKRNQNYQQMFNTNQNLSKLFGEEIIFNNSEAIQIPQRIIIKSQEQEDVQQYDKTIGIQAGQYIIGENKTQAIANDPKCINIATLSPGALTQTNNQNCSSPTNKVQKSFDFDIETASQNQILLKAVIKKDKKQEGLVVSNLNSTVQNKKSVSINKKTGMMTNIQNKKMITGLQNNNTQKPQKIKTMMNLTGPLPKNILSPGTVQTNQSKSKNKHSQYFDNQSEILSQQQQQFAYQQHLNLLNNNQIQNNQISQIPGSGPVHQLQVQLNGLNTQGLSAQQSSAQHHITTQGGSTVININIDSKGWGQQPPRQQPNNYNSTFQQNCDVHYLVPKDENQQTNQAKTQQFQPGKRQTSSKMRRNDSVSSNKSRGQGANLGQDGYKNKRSNSGNNMMPQDQNYRQNNIQNFMYNPNYTGQIQNNISPFMAPLLENNFIIQQQSVIPQTNSQIISQNIAKINEQLIKQQIYQQQHQQIQIQPLYHVNSQDFLNQSKNTIIQRQENSASDTTNIPQSTQTLFQSSQNIIQKQGNQKIKTIKKGEDNLIRPNQNIKIMNQTQLIQTRTQTVSMTHSDASIQGTLENNQINNQNANLIGLSATQKLNFAQINQINNPQIPQFLVIPQKQTKNKQERTNSQGLGDSQDQTQIEQSETPFNQKTSQRTIFKNQLRSSNIYSSANSNDQNGKLILKKSAQSNQIESKKFKIQKLSEEQIKMNKNIIESCSQIGSARQLEAKKKQLIQLANNPKQELINSNDEAQRSKINPKKQQITNLNMSSENSMQQNIISPSLISISVDYDQHLQKMENQIEQNQILLRNELAQMRLQQNQTASSGNGDILYQNMRLEGNYVQNNLSLNNQLQPNQDQIFIQNQQQNPGKLIKNVKKSENKKIKSKNDYNEQTNEENGQVQIIQQNDIHQQYQYEQTIIKNQLQSKSVPKNSNPQQMNFIKQYQFQDQAHQQQAINQIIQNNRSKKQTQNSNAPVQYQSGQNQNKQEKNNRRQLSHEEQKMNSQDGQSIRQNSQLRTSNQKQRSGSAQRGAALNQTSSVKHKTNPQNNRSTAISYKCSSTSNKSKGAQGRGSKFNNRISNGKVNIEDLNLDIDGKIRQHLYMDSSLGLAAAVHSFGVKKTVTTKNKALNSITNSKLHTQNVQSLLREAKREILIDNNEADQIYVGGDDLTINKKGGSRSKDSSGVNEIKQFNFRNTNNFQNKNQIGGYGAVLLQSQNLNIQYGSSPKNQINKNINRLNEFEGQFNNTSSGISKGKQISLNCANNFKSCQESPKNIQLQKMEHNQILQNTLKANNYNTNTQQNEYIYFNDQNQNEIALQNNYKTEKQVSNNNDFQIININTKNKKSNFISQQQNDVNSKTFGLEHVNNKNKNINVNPNQQDNQKNMQATKNFSYYQEPIENKNQKQQIQKNENTILKNSDFFKHHCSQITILEDQYNQLSQQDLLLQKQNLSQENNSPINNDNIQISIPGSGPHSQYVPDTGAEPDTAQSLKMVNMSEMTIDDDNYQPNDNYYIESNSVQIEIDNNNQQNNQNEKLQISDLQNQQQQNVQNANNGQDQLILPLSGPKVLKFFLKKQGLTEFEKSEVLDYKQCYFLGLGAEKIKGSKNMQYNSGYDDERGDYNVVLKDQIAYRFEVTDFLGKGSFGQALKCVDHKTEEIVAIKIIRNKKKFQHQAGVELKILLHLRENDPDDTNNIIRIKDYCMFRNHLIISFELFSINLYEFIKNNNFEGVSLSLIRRFAIQILQALKYLNEEQLIHCDLKPENILLKSPDKSGIKVIDFGSSCFQNERIYTYIQSRFYRAPEIVLGIPYTAAIDMWSFGCILTELFTGIPLFPGENEQEQLSLIMEVLGLPPQYVLQQGERRQVFFDQETNEPYLSKDSQGNLRMPFSKPLQEILMCQSDTFLDFISKCLEWDPEKRLKPFDALMHSWIIEGLPPQVLIHHKKMLGIYENEIDDSINQSQSILGVQDSNLQANSSKQFDQTQSQNLINQTSNSAVESSIQSKESTKMNRNIEQQQIEIKNVNNNNFDQKYKVIEKEMINQNGSINFYGAQHEQNEESRDIDFLNYDSQNDEECQSNIDYMENLNEEYNQQNGQGINAQNEIIYGLEDDSLDQHDRSIAQINMHSNQILGRPITDKDIPSRSGAMQENFIKTGKLNFKDFNQGNEKGSNNIKIQTQQQNFIGYQQVKQINKSQLATEEEDEINNDVNQLIGYDVRGFQNYPNKGSNLSGYENKNVHKKGKKNKILEDIIIPDASEKSKTTNISDILQQVNKKSKSTKNQINFAQEIGFNQAYGGLINFNNKQSEFNKINEENNQKIKIPKKPKKLQEINTENFYGDNFSKQQTNDYTNNQSEEQMTNKIQNNKLNGQMIKVKRNSFFMQDQDPASKNKNN